MKTKLEYRLRKFKKDYDYDEETKTIKIPDYSEGDIRIPIDLDIKSKTMKIISYIPTGNFNDDGSVERNTVEETEVRGTSVDTGIFNKPIIHLSKEYFTEFYDVLDIILYHEIAHLRLQLHNLFDGFEYIDQNLTNTNVFKLIIDNTKNKKVKETHDMFDRLFDVYHECFSEDDLNETNSCRYKMLLIIKDIFEKYSSDIHLTPDVTNMDMVFEIEADLYAISHFGYRKFIRYYRYEFPKYDKRINPDTWYKYYNTFLKPYTNILSEILNHPYVKEHLYIYRY